MYRDLTGLSEEKIEIIDELIAELRKKSWERHQIGSLHIEREGECGDSDENPCSGSVDLYFDVWEKTTLYKGCKIHYSLPAIFVGGKYLR